MLIQTEAQIYLSTRRGYSQTEGFRSYHTLNTDQYRAEGKGAFGALLAFNDNALAAGNVDKLTVQKTTEIVLVPIAGGIELNSRGGESVFISAGESFRFLAFPESDFTISNPYPVETINYLQIHLSPDLSLEAQQNHFDDSPLTKFSIEKKGLQIGFQTVRGKVNGYIGQYQGRAEDEITPDSFKNGVFTYIIQGAFEVQNRLLETGDALSLTNVEKVEFEALSNEAIILVVEVGM